MNFIQKRKDRLVYRNKPTGELTEISVYYSKGGANFSLGGTKPRGVYVSIGPLKVEDGCVSFTLFSGHAFFVEPLKALAPKRVQDVAMYFDKHVANLADIYETDKVCAIEALRGLCKQYQDRNQVASHVA